MIQVNYKLSRKKLSQPHFLKNEQNDKMVFIGVKKQLKTFTNNLTKRYNV